ncbi:MAG: hypothetical protein FJX44_05385 [Alphaproteobacteria bacterium]|nr:hypothetical protein [Alphaproteobacteria bacterium]
MIGSKSIASAFAVVALVGIYAFSLSEARAEDVPQPSTPQAAEPNASEAKPTAPRSPIRIKDVDYQDTKEGVAGRIKLAGTAAPDSLVYIYVDENPYVKVLADAEGNWSAEGELQLDGERHMLRAEQYDQETRMLAGRAMVTITRNPNANVEP